MKRLNVAMIGYNFMGKAHAQAEIFRVRLTKRAHHLRRWPTRQGITCYRLYDADVPEIPLIVDRYEDCLHVADCSQLSVAVTTTQVVPIGNVLPELRSCPVPASTSLAMRAVPECENVPRFPTPV